MQPAKEICKSIGISYRTMMRWVDQGFVCEKHLIRRGQRYFITEEGCEEIEMLSRLRKHLPLEQLKTFLKQVTPDTCLWANNGEYAVLSNATGQKQVLWHNKQGRLFEVTVSASRQLPLIDLFTLEDMLGSSRSTSGHAQLVMS